MALAQWRNMIKDDLKSVSAVAKVVHAELPERIEVFARRFEIFPEGCRVLASDTGAICGYAIAHPIRPFAPPELDAFPDAISPETTQLYIHDIAIIREFRGGNFARAIIADLLQLADRYESAALVSVYGTYPFWERFGFRTSEKDLSDKLAPYGADAVFMTRSSVSQSMSPESGNGVAMKACMKTRD